MDYQNLLATLLKTLRQSKADEIIADLWTIYDEMQADESEPEIAPDEIMLEFDAMWTDR